MSKWEFNVFHHDWGRCLCLVSGGCGVESALIYIIVQFGLHK